MSAAREASIAALDGQLIAVKNRQIDNPGTPEEQQANLDINAQIMGLEAKQIGLEEQNQTEADKEEKTAEVNRLKQIKGGLAQAKNFFSTGKDKAGGFLSSIPTPTGIGVPLFILVLMALILIPYNGKSRLLWFWLSVTGNATLDTSKASGLSGQPAQQGIPGLFGTTGNSNPAQSPTPTPITPVPGNQPEPGSGGAGNNPLPPIPAGIFGIIPDYASQLARMDGNF